MDSRYLMLFVLLVAVSSALTGPLAVAAETEAEAVPTVEEIVASTNRVSYYQGRDGRAQVSMTITDSQGRERTREFTILRLDVVPAGDETDTVCKDQKFYVYFNRPADVRKMVFMVHKHVEGDDDRWLYLPALDLVKRIAASDKRTSFVGSDFVYEDVSGRNIADDAHELLRVTDNYYVLKNTPKNPESVEFAYFEMFIDRKTFTVVSTVYYDGKGEKYRVYTAEKVETIDGFPTVTQSRMEDLRTQSVTRMSYSNVKYNIGLPDDIFTERYLRNAPREYLR